MITIILCNQPKRLKATLNRTSGPLRYLQLVTSPESRVIRNSLLQIPNARELPRAKLFREQSEGFRRKYISFLGSLNARNHSLNWWAMPFTNKLSIDSSLAHDVFSFLLIVKLAGDSRETLVVSTNSTELAEQVRDWADKKDVRVITLVKRSGKIKGFLKRYTPAGIIRAFLRTLIFWFLSRPYRPPTNSTGLDLAIVSLTHNSSFALPNAYRDVYFGPLVDHLAYSGVTGMVLGLIQERPMQQFKHLKQIKSGVPVRPVESYLTLSAVLACGFKSLRLFLRPLKVHHPIEIDGLDLSRLISQTVTQNCRNGEIFMSLRIFYAAQRLGRLSHMNRCIYPFENRSWEKMLIMGIRTTSPNTQITAYQHASLTPSHTNMLMEPEEAQIAPFPDIILTTGEITKDWMERNGNYPLGIFRTACALRQGQPDQLRAPVTNRNLRKILVAFSANLEQTVDTLDFLRAAFGNQEDYDIRLRSHPTLPIKSASEIVPLDHYGYYSESTGSLADDLEWADLVLYAFSTVSLEAIALGIPTIYLDLGGIINTDSLLAQEEFRWSVDDPANLVGIIESIGRIPDRKFRKAQRKGREYATAYLTPTTASGLGIFLEA